MITNEEVDRMIDNLRKAFGVATTDDLVKEMTNRFLSWKLPKDFSPDAGITFDRRNSYESPHWPIGTNLLTAEQAEEMIRHMLNLKP